MRILYGVQATGQGHISRARSMAEALQHQDVEVTWLFSGRSRDKLFDMELFGDFEHRTGLTFTTCKGQLEYLATVKDNKPFRFLRDVFALDISGYDLIVTDYEPVTAWAAKLRGRECIGIGHQYAFGPGTPRAGSNLFTRAVMSSFAPVSRPLGLHWHPYGDNVLPPILDLPELPITDDGHILVYLPFEDQAEVTRLLQQVPGKKFVQYANGLQAAFQGNVQCCPASQTAFKEHLASSNGVICNSGFELISECLHWRKPVLTKPLAGQTEQLSNALALTELGLGQTMAALSASDIAGWLASSRPTGGRQFQDVAACLAHWLAAGATGPMPELQRQLWQPERLPGSASGATSLAA